MLMPAVSMVARTRAMQPRTVRISFPRIAAAIEQSADGKVATGSLDNRTALGFSFRSHGPSFVIGAVIGLVLFSVARGPNPVALAGGGAFLSIVCAVIIARDAPKSLDVTSDVMLIRWRYRTRTVRSADIGMVLFYVSMKEAGRSDHERFFDTRITIPREKPLRVGFVCEGVVADLMKWVPHPKVTIRVIGFRQAIELHPRDVSHPVPGPPGS